MVKCDWYSVRIMWNPSVIDDLWTCATYQFLPQILLLFRKGIIMQALSSQYHHPSKMDPCVFHRVSNVETRSLNK